MSMDLTGITNQNEYYTNHYFATVFETNAKEKISAWNTKAKESEEVRTPWSQLRINARSFYTVFERFQRSSVNMQSLYHIKLLASMYLDSLGYPVEDPQMLELEENLTVPVFLEMKKNNGAPHLWVVLLASKDHDAGILESYAFDAKEIDEDSIGSIKDEVLVDIAGEELATKILFGQSEPPRFLLFISMNQIALIDRNKWNEKRYLQFELEDIFARMENSTLQAMSVLLHKDSLCPDDGRILLDELNEESQRNASGVSQDLKYALRESIELLGNEVLYDMETRQGRNMETDPVDAGQLTLECLRYMYRMLFILFIEARPELGYAPIKAQSYYKGYSLESLRDVADNIRDDIEEVGGGYYLHETLEKLYDLIYNGYPKTEEELKTATGSGSLHDMFLIAPLKAHIFDPEYTKMITNAKLRNCCMLRIIKLMSVTRETGDRNIRRGRISYANLGINQLGAVYEALLSYRGFIAERDLYEVKRAGDSIKELDVGYFVSEQELGQYTEEERARYDTGEQAGKLRMYKKGTFIYRLAGREREKSASYYTPEVLTKCLVKYALKELLNGKTADEILKLTVCEPAMGSAAFLNEAINQLAEAYISRKEKETGNVISYDKRFYELQKVKMFIADRNVYGIDLNPVAVELAEVSLWLNTIHEGGFVPWFGTQLLCGNSLIGARSQCYHIDELKTNSQGLRWFENSPERVPLGKKRKPKSQVYHFLLGDTGMCSYSDKVIKTLEPNNIKKMKTWNKNFTKPYSEDEVVTLLRLSSTIDELWNNQIKLRKEVEQKTRDNYSVFGHTDTEADYHTTIRQKDKILSELYKTENMQNAGPYARLKFAMDYWCALWFWPVEKADLLPSRSEFLFDMSLILEGTITSVSVSGKANKGLISLFTEDLSEVEKIAEDILKTYGVDSVVDIARLRKENPRLDLAFQIAEQNRFMHWELEFADLFEERGGFDLIIGNPPWIKITWEEKGILSDKNPMFAVRDLTATQTTFQRNEALKIPATKKAYYEEYTFMAGEQAFLNAFQNYAELKGQQTNLYKCFFPQAINFTNARGVFSFVHPDGVYNDPNGGALRIKLYPRLKYCFQFMNVLRKKLFEDVDGHVTFNLGVYSNRFSNSFDMISNIYVASVIDNCYDESCPYELLGLKDAEGNWSTTGHKDRILHIGKAELQLFSNLFDGSSHWQETKLPIIHTQSFIDVLKVISSQKKLGDLQERWLPSVMWDETNSQQDGTIRRKVHFARSTIEQIFSGPHISSGNACVKTPKSVVRTSSDYDNIDLTVLPADYFPRYNYEISCSLQDYQNRIPNTSWGQKFNLLYRIAIRKMLNLTQERTLMSAIIPPKASHINGILSIAIADAYSFLLFSGESFSLPLDFFVKIMGKTNLYGDTASKLPLLDKSVYSDEIVARVLLLSCLTSSYAELWEKGHTYSSLTWAKTDKRLKNESFLKLKNKWNRDSALRTDFERRQALIEIDVLVAMALGMTLEQLKTIYKIQFPVLQSYEKDTWYDVSGRIAFSSKSYGDLTCKRQMFENAGYVTPIRRGNAGWDGIMKHAPAGYVFEKSIIDDTMPGGPVERTIEYVAPFDCCNREKDYETAWKFFEEKYKNCTI